VTDDPTKQAEADRVLISPDGLLRFVVRTVHDDVVLGFDGFPWHTHADVLRATSQSGLSDTVERWISDLLSGRLVIAVARIGDTIRDIWVTGNPLAELRFCSMDEHIEFRLWNGTRLDL
jgi:hypothetical protein